MKLDQDLHTIIFDLMECHAATSKRRVKQSLVSVIQDKLDEAFDPDILYGRSELVINKNELVFTLLVSIDDCDETEYDSPDMEYIINIRNGKYTQQ